ncbi:MAG: PTS transporter subunit EIIA [Deltaproteobacteria bacterium]|jgi:nitrogen PTS system EIIA component|nr:PTS transporter subunit EIIA [Deltaproteobacteria bacterium]
MEVRGNDSHDEVMTLSEIANYLKVSEKTVSRMVRADEMPAIKVSNQWRFIKAFIDDWLMMKMQSAKQDDLVSIIATGEKLIPISRLVPPERIIVDLKPGSKEEILTRLVAPLASQEILANKENFIMKLLEREAMVSTAVGHGIALPHVRDPKGLRGVRPSIVLGICKEGVDFDSLDGEPTYIFALCVSPSEVVHLRLMAKISFLLRNEGVISSLRQAMSVKDVMSELAKADLNLTISL